MSKIINKILNGNSLKEIKKIPDKSFDLVFADPPYNMQIGETLTRPDACLLYTSPSPRDP